MWIADLEALSDEELVRRFVEGGAADALAVLLRRHQDRVFGLALRILGNRSDALDAAQEVFVGVFRKAKSFRHESAFTTWLYRLTVNACTDLARRRARLPQPSEFIEAVAADAIGRSDDRMAIESALAHLPVDQRSAVVLRDLCSLSYEELAEVTASPVGTVKSRIARGRNALAAHLAGNGPGGGPGAEGGSAGRGGAEGGSAGRGGAGGGSAGRGGAGGGSAGRGGAGGGSAGRGGAGGGSAGRGGAGGGSAGRGGAGGGSAGRARPGTGNTGGAPPRGQAAAGGGLPEPEGKRNRLTRRNP